MKARVAFLKNENIVESNSLEKRNAPKTSRDSPKEKKLLNTH